MTTTPALALAATLTALAPSFLPAVQETSAVAEPVDGADGVGDPYYPGLGNGGYDARHYDLVLDVDMSAGTVEARCTVTLAPTEALRSFHLDLVGLEVTEVTVDGAPATFTHEGRELEVVPAAPLAAGDEVAVRVAYRGKPAIVKDPGVPFVPGVGWMTLPDDGVYVVSEVVGAATFLPCNDHPRDKATYSFDVGVAEPWVVAANGLLLGREAEGDLVRHRFRASDPMATYLATICIAEFDVVEGETASGLPLTHYFHRSSNERGRAAFEDTERMIAYFETLFGPYPFECYGGVLSASPLGGALETQTLPVYSRGTDASTVAHELAHQWFGNHVSPTSWRDLWLNEGFAVFAEWLWSEHREDPRYERRIAGAYRMLKRRKVASPFDPGVAELFSGRVYVRGAWVLRALRAELGDETFFRLLRTWLERFGGGDASTEDFVALTAEVAGRDLGAWFDAYLFSDETPEDPDFTLERPAAPDAPADGEGD